jgi:hypothetical protein
VLSTSLHLRTVWATAWPLALRRSRENLTRGRKERRRSGQLAPQVLVVGHLLGGEMAEPARERGIPVRKRRVAPVGPVTLFKRVT